MKKTTIALLILFSATFTALGQSVTLTPTTDKQLTLTAAGVAVPNITGQRSNGTSAAPTALPNGAWMMSIYGRGYTGSGYSTNASSVIAFGAAQDFTPTANGSNIQFLTSPLNSIIPAERMRIDHNGNVGIGTNSPATTLDVNSPTNFIAKFNGVGPQMFISLHENGAYRGYLGSFSGAAEDVDFGTGNGTTGKLHLTIKAIPRLTIDTTGNVGIGTGTFATGEKFAVRNGTRQFGIMPGYFGNVPDANWTTFNSLALRISGEISVFGKIATNNALDVNGFSKLGNDAPAIKVKKLTGTTGAAQGDIIPISHGLTSTKILSITVLVQFETNGQYVPHSYTNTNGYQFDFYSDTTNIQVRNHPTNSSGILSKPIKVMITYEE
ncbi:MAG: hypothetical protein U0X91_22505 [Spirosomataceae bacterium]